MTLRYSPYDESLWSDPWPTYRRMQEEAPAYYIEDLDSWALSRFEDVWQASMDRKSYTAVHGTSTDALFLASDPPPRVFLFMDPPEHGRHRGLIGRSYLKDKVAFLDDHVRGVVRKLLPPLLEAGELDVYALSSRTALDIIAAFIGLELEEILHIRSLIDRFYLREPGVRGTTESGAKAFVEAHEFIVGLIERYRRNPPAEHSHIVSWLDAEIDGEKLTDEQIFFSIFAMVITGSDTVPLSTASAVYYLDRHSEQLALLRDDPTLAADAFEEAARFDQPTNLLGRRIAQDVELHGQTMRAGQSVLFLYAAACRDEREFDEPDKFDLRRRQRRNLSFGTGLHFCLGQHLARLEGRILLEEMLGAIEEFEVDQEGCSRVRGEFLQGFSTMPIRFDPR
ncbi:cytochrome P450 [Parasphingopyxis marina]|uniref:Cytochrome P450 n=1 Tax=Parasphingopyxis marina TaxID=2761622 RepID=A0A842HXS9_9SPHN|nr:cytochrome P450 [Parasphingopyxis marina]MBC2778978.1 cytochrome P450 [Parasphingopyxis marina]